MWLEISRSLCILQAITIVFPFSDHSITLSRALRRRKKKYDPLFIFLRVEGQHPRFYFPLLIVSSFSSFFFSLFTMFLHIS